MNLQQATIADFEAILAFYDSVTDKTPDIAAYAQWQKGKHPTAESIRAYIEEGSMYLYKENDIVGAMALTMYQEAYYHGVEWAVDAPDDKVAVIHILGVSPDRQGEGLGAKMVLEAIRLAQEKGMKAVRLDATASNTPVQRLYERLGFECRGKQNLYAENTGWLDFCFFEFTIDENLT
ncbi:MAG: GNAT family N-acetyltransferase [Prevotella sp.]|nr:GNAT family N-acetyltransferase [Prevotella sp.]